MVLYPDSSEFLLDVSSTSEIAEISAQNAALRLQLEDIAQTLGKSRRIELGERAMRAINVTKQI